VQLLEIVGVVPAGLFGDRAAPDLGWVGRRMTVVAQHGSQPQNAPLLPQQLDRGADLRRMVKAAASLARVELQTDVERKWPASRPGQPGHLLQDVDRACQECQSVAALAPRRPGAEVRAELADILQEM